MAVVLLDRPDAGLLDVRGGVEVGLADLHVDDPPALSPRSPWRGPGPRTRFRRRAGRALRRGSRRGGRSSSWENLHKGSEVGGPGSPNGGGTDADPDGSFRAGRAVVTRRVTNARRFSRPYGRTWNDRPRDVRLLQLRRRRRDRAAGPLQPARRAALHPRQRPGRRPRARRRARRDQPAGGQRGRRRRGAAGRRAAHRAGLRRSPRRSRTARVFDLQAALVANETDVIGSNVVRLVAHSAPVLDNPDTVAVARGGAGRRAGRGDRLLGPGAQQRPRHRPRRGGRAAGARLHRLRRRAAPASTAARSRSTSAAATRSASATRPSRRTALAAGATLVVEYRARIDSPLDDNTRIVLGGAVASSETAEFELARAELTVRSASRFDTEATRAGRRRAERGRARPPGAGRADRRERRHLRRRRRAASA